jgi:hypothetical protein
MLPDAREILTRKSKLSGRPMEIQIENIDDFVVQIKTNL